MSTSPLDALHIRAGARFLPDRPCHVDHYGDRSGELAALQSRCGLVDLATRRTVRVDGRDRIRYLNAMLSNDLTGLTPGSGTYTLLLTPQGKFVSDQGVYLREDHCLLALHESSWKKGLEMLDRYLIADKATLTDVSASFGWLSVLGPLAGRVLTDTLQVQTLPSAQHGHLELHLGDIPLLVIRESPLGEEGYEIMAPQLAMPSIWTALCAAGATPVGLGTLDHLRIGRGIPLPGKDVTETNIATEGGPWLEGRSISYQKGCYIGQEVICRVKARGQVNWMLTAFEVEGEAEPGARLVADGKDVGWITSVTTPSEGRSLGLGYVHRKVRVIGSRLPIAGSEGQKGVILQEVASAPVG